MIVIESNKRVVGIFLDKVPFAMVALKGFLEAKPDRSKSTGQAAYNLLRKFDIYNASIVFNRASISDA